MISQNTFSKYRNLILFTLAYLGIAAYFYISKGNWEFIAYLGVTIIVGLILITTIEKSGIDRLSLWLMSGWGLVHMLGGLVPVGDSVLYGWKIVELVDRGGGFYILKMDQVIHFYGFAVAAMILYQMLRIRVNSNVLPGTLIFFATMGSLGLSAVNEIIEFMALISLEKTGVGDIYNLGLDLIFNICGAFTGAWIESKRSKKSL